MLFSKEFLACNGCFGLFTKLKRSLALAFGAHFLHDYSIKMFLINLSMDKVSTFFPSQNNKQNVLLSSYLDS